VNADDLDARAREIAADLSFAERRRLKWYALPPKERELAKEPWPDSTRLLALELIHVGWSGTTALVLTDLGRAVARVLSEGGA
jgi:hypothetical protein